MSENNVIVITFGVVIVMVIALVVYGGYLSDQHKENMAKAGLQQCVVGEKTIWQKECK